MIPPVSCGMINSNKFRIEINSVKIPLYKLKVIKIFKKLRKSVLIRSTVPPRSCCEARFVFYSLRIQSLKILSLEVLSLKKLLLHKLPKINFTILPFNNAIIIQTTCQITHISSLRLFALNCEHGLTQIRKKQHILIW